MPFQLEGTRRSDWLERTGQARKLGRQLAAAGKVAYWNSPQVVEPADNRTASRAALRLRSAKLLTLQKRFICECRVRDRSSTGLGLLLAKNLPLPAHVCIFDDETGQAFLVSVAWRRNMSVGVRIRGRQKLRPSEKFAFGGRYYAVPDR